MGNEPEISAALKLQGGITLFSNHLDKMIAWRPGEFSYWETRNVGVVNTSGIEASAACPLNSVIFGGCEIFIFAYEGRKASGIRHSEIRFGPSASIPENS